MKKLLLLGLLISIIFISGCFEEQQAPDKDSDQQQEQQTNFYPISETNKQIVIEQINDPQVLGYDDVTVTSTQSLTTATMLIEEGYRESDVTKIFELLTQYSNSQTYTVTFIIDRGMVGADEDDTRCVYTANVDTIYELDSRNWIDWKETITLAECG